MSKIAKRGFDRLWYAMKDARLIRGFTHECYRAAGEEIDRLVRQCNA